MLFCLFKQKAAYEMRISVWSSDVCSADLLEAHLAGRDLELGGARPVGHRVALRDGVDAVLHGADVLEQAGHRAQDPARHPGEADDQSDGNDDGADGAEALHPDRTSTRLNSSH